MNSLVPIYSFYVCYLFFNVIKEKTRKEKVGKPIRIVGKSRNQQNADSRKEKFPQVLKRKFEWTLVCRAGSSPCTFTRCNILHIWCVVVTNLSVCLFVCQQVACDVVTVFSIGVAVPCLSQSNRSIVRSISQSISQSISRSVTIPWSTSWSVILCLSVPVYTCPLSLLYKKRQPALLPTYIPLYYHTMLPILFPYTTTLEEKQNNTSSNESIHLCVHRFHLRSPLLGQYDI